METPPGPHMPMLPLDPDASGREPADPERAPPAGSWRHHLHQIVFESDTPAGRAFDLTLIALILISVAVVSVETVTGLDPGIYRLLRAAEWVLTLLFTVEYALRLAAVKRPLAYATSFFGVIDLLAILPTYISLLVPGAQVLLVVRILRVLRVFRVLKLTRFLTEANTLQRAVRASARKVIVFLVTVAAIVVVVGAVMYTIEGPRHGFTSIPRSMYWTVVTLTTVGYGDISPKTGLGQALASLVMILGYGIIAVPTGIVTAELTATRRDSAISGQACPVCGVEGHDMDARHCRRCGARL